MESLLIWGLVLLAMALAVVVVDLFLPTAGILAAVSIVLAIAGVVCLFRYDTTWGIIGSLLVIVGGPSLFVVGFKLMPHTPMGKRLILGGGGAGDQPPPQQGSPLARLIGTEAMVVTDLRPVGVVRIGDQKFEAVSETTLIRAGATVRITAADGLSLKVRPV
ncbi:MAG: NfeD family protein [Phycisphaerales bacterium]|nr:NfeD family protein [Phycisphaerales bacterium]